MNQHTRDLLEHRSQGVCELCGIRRATNTHHRRPRGMGGSRLTDTDTVVNLIRLCGSGTTGCHSVIEVNRQEARERGLLVRQGASPASIPVRLAVGLVYLTEDGNYLAV